MRDDRDSQLFRMGLQDETQNANRTLIGQITSVDNRRGLITVRTVNGQSFEMPIPLIGFSPQTQVDADGNPISGLRSSWIRYMPQNFDFVKVAFGPDRRPECVGMACWGDLENSPGPLGQLGGYNDVVRAREEGIPGFTEFRDLRPGEWDMRSRGNAYIFGSATGVLFLAGGGAQLVLRKEDDASRLRATLQRYESTDSYLLLTGPLDSDGRILEQAQNEGDIVHTRAVDANGNARHEGTGSLTLTYKDDISADAGNTVSILAENSFTLESASSSGQIAASSTLNLDASNINVSASSNVATSATNIDMSGSGSITMTAPSITADGFVTLGTSSGGQPVVLSPPLDVLLGVFQAVAETIAALATPPSPLVPLKAPAESIAQAVRQTRASMPTTQVNAV